MDEMTLDELRASRNVTQAQLSNALGITQAAVSKLEFRNDAYLSSVRKYIDAIGGTLELHAVFPDRKVKVRGLGGDETLTLLRRMFRFHCTLNPPPVGSNGPVPNKWEIAGMDEDERYLELHKLGSGFHVFIPVRRILEVRPAPPHGKEATLRLDGFVRMGPGRNDCAFVERQS